MKLFRCQKCVWVVLAAFALASNVLACALRCAQGVDYPAALADGGLGPLAFCASGHGPEGGTGGKEAGASQHHCVVCQAATALARAMVAVFVPYPAARQEAVAFRSWDGPPPLAAHILSGALRSRAPPLSAPPAA